MVFKTMAENIKSFFNREESLEKEPKKVPDAAVELFERPHPAGEKIVEHALHSEPQSAPAQKLPFSSDELRARLAKQRSSQPPSQRSSEHIEVSEEDISSQIEEFEQAINTMPGQSVSHSQEPLPPADTPTSSTASQSVKSSVPSYFDRLSSKLKEGDASLLENSLNRMKEHHASHSAREEYLVKTEELEHQLSQKLAELQGLEHEWSSKVSEAEAAGKRIEELEALISQRTNALRTLVLSIRDHSNNPPQLPAPVATEKEEETPREESPAKDELHEDELHESPVMGVPPTPSGEPVSSELGSHQPEDHSFLLNDGRLLSTIGDLKEALSSMDDSLYYHHVRSERNDFAEWLRGVFGESELATRLEAARNRMDMVALLADQ